LKDLGYNVPDFDFALDGVCSVTIDPHKMGFSTIPAGALLVRKKDYLSSVAVKTPYLTNESQTTIIGTRCSAGTASAYASMKYLGRNGYRRIVKECMKNTLYMAREIERIGMKLVMKPTMNILGISVKRPKKIVNDMCKLNWKIGSLDSPKCIRIVVMPHKRSSIYNFLADFEKVCRRNKEI
jgi:tyrosine decarboxylase/aspartate 1-decarboxylase